MYDSWNNKIFKMLEIKVIKPKENGRQKPLFNYNNNQNFKELL